ncbi:hypothetical protein KGF86_11140 [Ornithinibacillus massiliensis]|uniref:DUF4262 domain-containing protein n=1 Tax=Ornithinibacillus massiliensis TaxID=1944633 RepID=A0ABS5MEL5_9BACI|nr:hypothetical protein [Ornithinibacillus massiliensis]
MVEYNYENKLGETMKRMELGSWIIEVDVMKTKEFYNHYHLITEDCDCEDCANYVLACETFPHEIKALFHSLGIDPRKEGEISHYIANQDGTHVYGIFYHIVGRIIDGPENWPSNVISTEVLTPYSIEQCEADVWFTQDLALVPEGFPKPIIQVEIKMNVPWLLK